MTLPTGDTGCLGVRNELLALTLSLFLPSRLGTLGFAQPLGFSQWQAPVWILLVLARAALALDAAIGTDAHPPLLTPLLELTHQ
tara:strand:+ start:700 stop:951 length:252 start_codon:yes stop_codon:yes gene_type:complete